MNYLHTIIPCIILTILFPFILILIIRLHTKKTSVIQKVKSLSVSEKKKLLDTLAQPVGYFYDPYQDIFAARQDAPQKVFGYTLFYDFSAPYFNMVFDYETIYFDYSNRTWLIEMWKGQYGINSGCELGIYYADHIVSPDEYNTTHFQAVDARDMLEISLWLNRHTDLKALYNEQFSGCKARCNEQFPGCKARCNEQFPGCKARCNEQFPGCKARCNEQFPVCNPRYNGQFFHRKNEYCTRLGRMRARHWWLTIFNMGTFSKPKELSVNTSIRFHNGAMMYQFLDSFRKTLPNTKYKVNGFTVYFTFNHSSRKYNLFKKAVRRMALFFCELYCRLFNYITKPFEQSGDKLLYLYFYLPFAVRLLFRPKRSPKTSKAYTAENRNH